MYRLTLFFSFFLVSGLLQAQTFNTSSHIISTPLYAPFEDPRSFGLSYERMLDKGQSPNAAQFAVKFNLKKISDKKKWTYTQFDGIDVFDEDAFQYSGFSFIPEVKYYFTWDAPFGVYFNLFGALTTYTESFYNIIDYTANYNKRFIKVGRGIGLGYQFRIRKVLSMDINAGYMMEDVSPSQQSFGETEFTALNKLKEDGLRINATFGFSF